MVNFRAMVLAALLGLISGFSASAEVLIGVASVVDADTIEIHGVRVRLHGIDAPERHQRCLFENEDWRCGKEATFALADRIERQTVSCAGAERDRWDRLIAVCHHDGVDLSEWLVRGGWALAYRKYSKDYILAEEDASRHAAGIWRGAFVKPWDWRRGERIVAKTS